MANIKFSYLYRDGANYKNFGDVVFANPDNVVVEELEKIIKSKLISKTWFDAGEWLLPHLYFEAWDKEFDHSWHEFESVTYTREFADFSVSLRDWIARIAEASSAR